MHLFYKENLKSVPCICIQLTCVSTFLNLLLQLQLQVFRGLCLLALHIDRLQFLPILLCKIALAQSD